MLSSLQLNRFRSFSELKLDGLSRANLIIGQNNTGKTALLEALFLLMGSHNSEIPFRLAHFRGIDTPITEAPEIWSWLFHEKSTDRGCTVEAETSDGVRHQLTISVQAQARTWQATDPRSGVLDDRGSAPLTTARARPEFRMVLARSSGTSIESRAAVEADRIELTGAPEAAFPVSVFMATRARTQAEDADRLSRLEEAGRDEQVARVLNAVDPRLRRLSVYSAGGQSMLRADLGERRLVPIGYLGDGFRRVTSMVLAALSIRGGLFLIDEIENGVHHTVLKRVWTALAAAAQENDVQIFATTHSWECVVAADLAQRENLQYELATYRLERAPAGIQAVRIDGRSLETASQQGWDLR